MQGSEYQRLFLFQLNSAYGNGLQFRSIYYKENINILLLLTSSFPQKPLKTSAHGLPKISRNLSSNGPTFDKKYKKGFPFSNIGIKEGKMGTETLKIALNAHVHLRMANQQMSRPERHVDDITELRLGDYSTILTSPEMNNCFSIFTRRSDLNRIRKETIKKLLA